jgi:dephospho-CoA kinase
VGRTLFKHGPKAVIGLVGAIGAGKSTAARAFAARGARVVDADALGHEALRQPQCVETLVSRWGEQVRGADGALDRRAIARIVFADQNERNALESVVFPFITGRARDLIFCAQSDPAVAFVVLDAAVLLEAGWGELVDWLVYVDAPRELRLERLAARSGWSDADLTAREAAQWPAERKKARADALIENSGDSQALQRQVDSALARFGILLEQ